MIPLIAESEKGRGQTESPFEKKAEMWWRSVAKFLIKSSLEKDTIEGDSPVFEENMLLFNRVLYPRLDARIQQN